MWTETTIKKTKQTVIVPLSFQDSKKNIQELWSLEYYNLLKRALSLTKCKEMKFLLLLSVLYLAWKPNTFLQQKKYTCYSPKLVIIS